MSKSRVFHLSHLSCLSAESGCKQGFKQSIMEPLTDSSGALTGPWEINKDCMEHMSYIIDSPRTLNTTCKL